jgi:Fe-S cluster assembly protein SufD
MATTTDRSIAPGAFYPSLFGAALPQLPGSDHAGIRRLRQASFDRFMTLGFPGPKTEAWKYTSVGRLARADFELAPAVNLTRAAIKPYVVPGVRHLVFVNGHFAADLSDAMSAAESGDGRVIIGSVAQALARGDPAVVAALPESDPERAFSALNDAFAADGCLIRLGDGVSLERPIQLLFVVSGDGGHPTLINPRNVVIVGDGARLDLIESHVMLDAGHSLTNLINQTLATLGGALVRNEIRAVIQGSGVEATFNGMYFTRDRQHVDNNILVDHAAPGSVSDQFYKGILDGRSQAVFAGKIVVRRQAQKTNAYQANNNLLLSPEAEIDTKPELEIFADDVKCSHGATAGELDERELFYLRSRGLDPVTARNLLTFAFAGAVLERFTNPAIAEQARAGLLRGLPGGAALEELR